MKKLVRITTVPISLKILLNNQLTYMKDYYEVIAVSSDEKELKEVAVQSGVRTVPINMTRKVSPIADTVALFRLIRFFKKEKPLIVHTHTPKAGLLGMVAARLTGIPIRLHTVAGMPLLETQGIRRKVLELAEKMTYRCAVKVYPNSHEMKNIIIRNGYSKADKLKVIGSGSSNGIDCSYFDSNRINATDIAATRQKLGISEKDFVFCFIGRIVSAKGIKELVNAFVQLALKNDHVKLVLVGSFEPDLDPIDATTLQHLQHHPAIKMAGFQNDVRPYLACCHVFVFPSYREGFPNVVMQAGAMGVPCIVSDINGCNEIIIEGKNGLIVPAKDAEALRQAMAACIADPELICRMAKSSRELIVQRYDQKAIWSCILAEYQIHQQSQNV
jgi:glycosyltransferase involved in cell wall biosynthesis